MVSFFALDRDIDATGVSGTGRVAVGTGLDSGVLVTWTAIARTIGWYATLEQVEQVHGHGGATQVTEVTAGVEQVRIARLVGELLAPAGRTISEALDRFAHGEVTAFGLDRDEPAVEGGATGRLAIVVDLGSGALVYWNDWNTLGWYPDLDTVQMIHCQLAGTRLTKLTDTEQRHEAVAPIPATAAAALVAVQEAAQSLAPHVDITV